jgi:hypothetical protein
MMRILYRVFILLLLTASLQGQAPTNQYTVIKTEDGEPFINRVNELADLGYRVLFVSRYTVLRRDAIPPDTYRYLRVEVSGGPKQFSNWINEQGARGYRWVPSTDLLEKAPHPRNYEYLYRPHTAKANELSSLVEQGFHPLQTTYFSHPFGSSTPEMFFERDLDAPGPAATPEVGKNIAVSDAMRSSKVMMRVDELARQGYRVRGPHPSAKGGGVALLLEKCQPECAGRYQYRKFAVKDAAQVETDLNALGTDGFQVLPASLEGRLYVVERDTRDTKKFVYRVLDPADLPALELALNAAAQQGYEPIQFAWHIGWSVHGFLLLQKEITDATAP